MIAARTTDRKLGMEAAARRAVWLELSLRSGGCRCIRCAWYFGNFGNDPRVGLGRPAGVRFGEYGNNPPGGLGRGRGVPV
jgi:hypothetical protein